MGTWEQFVAGHMLYVWAGIAVLSIGTVYLVAKKLPPGLTGSLVLAVVVVPITIAWGALVSLALATVWNAETLSIFARNIGGAASYLFETGLEYSTPVFLFSAMCAAYFRLRPKSF